MKKFLMIVMAVMIAFMMPIGAAAANNGSDGPTPYTVDERGITLRGTDTFRDNGHVNIRYTGGSGGDTGMHFESKCINRTDAECAGKRHADAQYIGKNFIPWSAFGLGGNFCVTWVQISHLNQHFGEGGQQPVCVDPDAPDPQGKNVTLCHAGQDGYEKMTVTSEAWYKDHKNDTDDIWEAFTYKTVNGVEINVPKQGNTNLLDFARCEPPVQNVKVVPSITSKDVCYTDNDKVELVPGTGYSGGAVRGADQVTWTVTATTNPGYIFDIAKMGDWTLSSGNHKATKVVVLTNEDCDLPETGGEASYNVNMGIAAVALLLTAAAGFILMRRKN